MNHLSVFSSLPVAVAMVMIVNREMILRLLLLLRLGTGILIVLCPCLLRCGNVRGRGVVSTRTAQ